MNENRQNHEPHKFKMISMWSFYKDFFFTFQIGMIVTLLLITILSKLDSDAWQDTFLTLTIFGIVLINAFSAVFQGKTFIAETTVYVSASLACLRVGGAS